MCVMFNSKALNARQRQGDRVLNVQLEADTMREYCSKFPLYRRPELDLKSLELTLLNIVWVQQLS